jgi:hypothetical protein
MFFNKLNFWIYLATILITLGLEGFRRNNSSFRNLMYITSLYFLSYILLDWKLKKLYFDSYYELRKNKSEEDIILNINNISTKTKISI